MTETHELKAWKVRWRRALARWRRAASGWPTPDGQPSQDQRERAWALSQGIFRP